MSNLSPPIRQFLILSLIALMVGIGQVQAMMPDAADSIPLVTVADHIADLSGDVASSCTDSESSSDAIEHCCTGSCRSPAVALQTAETLSRVYMYYPQRQPPLATGHTFRLDRPPQYA